MTGSPRNTGSGGAGFGSQWGSSFYWPIVNAVVASTDSARDMYSVRDAILQRFETDAWKRVIYSENHDEVASINNKIRLPEAIWRGHADSWFARKRSTLAAVLVFTSPGIPMIFQGQEFLEWGSWSDSDSPRLEQERSIQWHLGFVSSLSFICAATGTITPKGLRGQHVNVYHVNNNDKVIALPSLGQWRTRR